MLELSLIGELVAAREDAITHILFERKDRTFKRMLDQLLPQLYGDLRQQTERCQQLYQSLSGRARWSILSHPFFHHWWLTLITWLKRGERAQIEKLLPDLSRFLLIPGLQEGVWKEEGLWLTVNEQKEIRFPGHPNHIDLSECNIDVIDQVWCTIQEEHVMLTWEDWSYRMPLAALIEGKEETRCLRRRKMLQHTMIEIDTSDALIHSTLEHVNALDPVPPYPKRDIRAVATIDEDLLSTYNTVIQLIERAWPELKEEMDKCVRLIVPFSSALVEGWSEKQLPGVLFIRNLPGNTVFTLEHLVHEASHTRLYSVQELVPLYTNAPTDLFPSPLRKDLRPVQGIYHAAFVLGRIIECMLRVAQTTGLLEYRQRALEIVPQFTAAVDTLQHQIKLTKEGAYLLKALVARVQTCMTQQAIDNIIKVYEE
jgi:hypothetical protein